MDIEPDQVSGARSRSIVPRPLALGPPAGTLVITINPTPL